jgi:aryl-alcohol dehydrogenase-like predicted oxidoreductase
VKRISAATVVSAFDMRAEILQFYPHSSPNLWKETIAMQYRTLGRSDLDISPVMLGTWAMGGWLWGGTAQNQSEEAILAAIDAGVNAIDTAPVYGFGLSEEIVGKAILHRDRDKLVIATKCGLVWDGRPGATPFFETTDNTGKRLSVKRCLRKESIVRECEDSLRRLDVDTIDLYQCHWPHAETPISESLEALTALRDQGKIRAFGVSNYSASELGQCADNGGIASDQPKYSLLSREAETDVLPFCLENDIGVIAYSPMEMGLLTGKITMNYELPDNDTRTQRPWFQSKQRSRVLDALDRVKPIAARYDASLAQVAVAWVFSQPGVTSAIVGARNPEQAVSNARAADLDLAPGDIRTIRTIFEPLVLDEPFDVAKVRR